MGLKKVRIKFFFKLLHDLKKHFRHKHKQHLRLLVFIHERCNIWFPLIPSNLVSVCLPHLLVTVLLECWVPVGLLSLYPFFLFLLGLRRQHELLSYLLLRDELGDGTRFPAWVGWGRGEGDGEGHVWQINEKENRREHMAPCSRAAIIESQ